MNHTVFKQKWRKESEDGEVGYMYSIHLNNDKINLFIKKEQGQPTLPGFEPDGHPTPFTVNEEIYGLLEGVNGIWTEENTPVYNK